MLSVRISSAVLALLSLTCIYSCAGRSNSDKESNSGGKISKSRPIAAKPKPGITPSKPGLPTYHFDRPAHVKGLYWTAWVAGSKTGTARLMAITDKTEINAAVVDVRDEGQMYFKTGIPLADDSGANHIAVAKPAAMMKMFEDHKVWPIARIACFRDNFVTVKHPELAIQFPDHRVWSDRKRNHWLDPYNKKNWEYLAACVDFALDMGFPEIQLDYVRFPSEGKAATQFFPAKKDYPSGANGLNADVIADFTKFIGDRVHKRHGVFSVDIFGIISSTKGDEGIGQQLEKVSASFDVLSPMIYPSHFAKGEYGIKNPNEAPYQIIKKSLDDYKKRLPKTVIRPWLQAFNLGGMMKYSAKELKAQIKATRDVGYQGFLIWNAQNRYPYAVESLGPKPAQEQYVH